MPSDIYVKDDSSYDEAKAYVEDYKALFMRELLPTLMLSAEGQRNFLSLMGMEIVGDQNNTF